MSRCHSAWNPEIAERHTNWYGVGFTKGPLGGLALLLDEAALVVVVVGAVEGGGIVKVVVEGRERRCGDKCVQ